MIDLPRAALRAGDLAATAQIFSVGQTDLTQTTFGISRDGLGRFLAASGTKGVFATGALRRGSALRALVNRFPAGFAAASVLMVWRIRNSALAVPAGTGLAAWP